MMNYFNQLRSSASGFDTAFERYRKQLQQQNSQQPADLNADRERLNDLGYEFLDQSRAADALKLFQLNLEFSPHDWSSYESLALAYYEQERYELASINFQQALNMLESSDSPLKGRRGLLKKIARTYLKLGNHYAALYVYQIEIARDPEADWAVQKIGQWMLKYGNPSVGMRWLKRATDMQGSPDKAWGKLGKYLQKGSTYRYIHYLREGRDRFPYLASSWDRLIAALLDDYRFREAERVVAQALSLFQAESLWRTARSQAGQQLIKTYTQDIHGESFTAMGCGPYWPEDEQALKHYMKVENASSNSKFIIHLGDLGKGIDEVPESRYANMADILSTKNAKPAFVVLGDNDWNDTNDPAKSLGFWKHHLGSFYHHFKLPFNVKTQPQREENFSFEPGDVVYIGINLPEGRVHDEAEWRNRIKDDGDWIQLSLATSKAKAAVILSHAPADVFDGLLLTSLEQSATDFAKPLLFLNANGHRWFYRKSDWAANITHVQLDKLHSEDAYPPVQIRYTGRDDMPFVFDRRIGAPDWLVK